MLDEIYLRSGGNFVLLPRHLSKQGRCSWYAA